MPFGPYKDFAECVNRNKDKDNPEAYCALLHYKITGQWPGEKDASFYSFIQAAFKNARMRVAAAKAAAEKNALFQLIVRAAFGTAAPNNKGKEE